MRISEKPNDTINLHHWLKSTYPNAKYCLVGDDYSGLDWSDTETTKPTAQQCTDGVSTMQLAYESNKYQRDRVLEYPSIGDQLDMIYHSGIGGTEFQAAIKAVKDAHPKGGN